MKVDQLLLSPLLLYAVGALAFIVWAMRRLFLAWTKGYVTEVDDPHFGFETADIRRLERSKRFWASVIVTSVLLLAALIFLSFIGFELVSGTHVQ